MGPPGLSALSHRDLCTPLQGERRLIVVLYLGTHQSKMASNVRVCLPNYT
jgi:hypothetical protein